MRVRVDAMLLLLLSCKPTTPTDTAAASAEDDTAVEPTAWPTSEADAPVAQLSTEEMAVGITSALAAIYSIDPELLYDAQDSAATQMSDTCPNALSNGDSENWFGQCDTDDGAQFSGSVDYTDLGSYSQGRYSYTDYVLWIGTAIVNYSDGNSLWAAGRSEQYIRRNTENSNKEAYHEIRGNYTWSHPGAQGSWIEKSYGLVLTLEGWQYASGGTAVAINGSITGTEGASSTWKFSDFLLYDQDDSGEASSCALEPSGVISAQDADGHWYDVHFHGPGTTDAASFPPDCDGCGQLYFHGEVIGDVCPDFSAVLDWDGAPWK